LWTKALINFYETYYKELKEYVISPYQADNRLRDFPRRTGASFRAPLEDQSILNAEFDLAVKWLGPSGNVYRTKFLEKKGKVTIEDRAIKRELVSFLLDSNSRERSRMSEAYQ